MTHIFWRYHQASKGHLKISRQEAGHFVVVALVILGWWIAYERGTRMQNPTPEMDALGHWPLITVQCIHFHSWTNSSIWPWPSSNSWRDFVCATLCLHICMIGNVPSQSRSCMSTSGYTHYCCQTQYHRAKSWGKWLGATWTRSSEKAGAHCSHSIKLKKLAHTVHIVSSWKSWHTLFTLSQGPFGLKISFSSHGLKNC